MAHYIGAGKMFTRGQRELVRSSLVARSGWGGGEVGCHQELDSTVMVEERSDGLN
jgi:hypothetical protein